jgi:formylglycine-generating enzyme required for sulfatase activity
MGPLVAAIIAAAVPAAVVPACRPGGQSPSEDPPPAAVTTAGGVEMVLVPGGWFEMGSPPGGEADETRHRVHVSPFYMDRGEVTQEEYQRVMGENPSRWKAPANPVEQIRWPQAAAYCNARSRSEAGLRS